MLHLIVCGDGFLMLLTCFRNETETFSQCYGYVFVMLRDVFHDAKRRFLNATDFS